MDSMATVALAVLIVGAIIGALATYFAMKGVVSQKIAAAVASVDANRISLAEQLKASIAEVKSLTTRLTDAEQQLTALRNKSGDALAENASLAERAKLIAPLEEQLAEKGRLAGENAAEIVTLRENCSKLSAELEGKISLVSTLKEESKNLSLSLSQAGEERVKLANELADLREAMGRQAAEIQARDETISGLRTDLSGLIERHDKAASEAGRLQTSLAEVNTALEAERTQSKEKIALINEAREQLSNQFKALASEILDDKSKKFTEQNQTNLGQLLEPLKQQLTDFKAKVEEVYVNEGKDRSALGEQVRQLISLNNTLSQDAQNLTSALKGDRKAQGNWGELILDDVLEKAGLISGQHYRKQDAIKDESGTSHVIPDVIIDLPGDRHLVVDSKLTLPDYRAFASAGTDEDRTDALKRHIVHIRNHMRGLSEKNYHSLYGLSSLDFVVMFVPLEPAFMLAVTNDAELFQNAWEKNVLLVSPSTLLFVVRTVANLWRQEGLSRNAQLISSRGAELYDKLVGFAMDLDKLGKRLEQAQESYRDARIKLSSGKGNVIRQAEMLKTLGVKPSKSLPPSFVDQLSDEDLPLISDLADDMNPLTVPTSSTHS